MSGDGLTRTPFAIVPRWVIQRATSNGLKVYAYLSDRANPEKGNTCWPSIETIANDTGLSGSTVKRHIKELIDLGALRREARYDGHNKRSNLYTVEFNEQKPEVTGDPYIETTGDPHIGTTGDPYEGTTGDPQIRTIEQEPTEQDTPLPPSLPLGAPSVLIMPDENPAPGHSPGPDSTDGFDEFWSQYPRKVGKGQARKCWARMKAGARASALAAVAVHAERWAETGTDPQYIPHPATWLNAERWDDELTPAAPTKRKGVLAQMDDAFEAHKEELARLHELNTVKSPVLELPTETGDTP